MVNEEYLSRQAKKIRASVLEITYRAKAPSIGCSLSIVDILTVLYFGDILRVDPNRPDWKERDKFILSKGHGCAAFYVTLAMREFFPLKKLEEEYGKDGSMIPFHSTLRSLPGIETTNGSLGHGLALGIGMALDARKNNRPSRIFVLVGDGECQEGSVWEALMFAGFHKLNNLVLIIDNNNLETVDNVSKILDLEPLDEKIQAFGWEVKIANGHSFPEIAEVLNLPPSNKPLAMIAKTIKGKGISFMENMTQWHGNCPNQEEYQQAKKELEETEICEPR